MTVPYNFLERGMPREYNQSVNRKHTIGRKKMSDLNIEPIEEKMEAIEIMGQGCRNDCTRYYWKGDETSKKKKCYKKEKSRCTLVY